MATRGRYGWLVGLAVGTAFVVCAVPASAAPAGADLQIELGASTEFTQNFPTVPNGSTVTVTKLNFVAAWIVYLINVESGSAKIRFELGSGLRFGADGPDPTEQCTGTTTVATCDLPTLYPDVSSNNWALGWDVVAAAPGSYNVRAEITDASTADPVIANNSASITVVVAPPSSGGGGAVKVSAGAAKVSPAKPKAGGAVAATVRVTANGALTRPTGLACSGKIGVAKMKATKKAALGSAKCTFRTPKSAKGKTLRGSVSFTARGKRFTKRFSAKLG